VQAPEAQQAVDVVDAGEIPRQGAERRVRRRLVEVVSQ
jgi:hypothetical protein